MKGGTLGLETRGELRLPGCGKRGCGILPVSDVITVDFERGNEKGMLRVHVDVSSCLVNLYVAFAITG